jgi:hypothetical protein
MKTLLTDKEIIKFHPGDKRSARCVMKIGDVIKTRKNYLTCVDKIIFKIDTCPHCGNHNTFHKRSQKIYGKDNKRNYDNVYKIYREDRSKTLIYQKIDYCLDCHKEFSIEIFIYIKKHRGVLKWLMGI